MKLAITFKTGSTIWFPMVRNVSMRYEMLKFESRANDSDWKNGKYIYSLGDIENYVVYPHEV